MFVRPPSLLRDLTWGQLFIPFVTDGRWLSPIGAVTIAAAALFVVRCLTARRPLVDLSSWLRSMRDADLLGATYLAVSLGGVILAFATADVKVEVFADQGWWYLLGSAVAAVAFVLHLRRAAHPLVPRGSLRARPAWGAILVSFFMGAALMAAVLDIPLFARTTVHRESQLLAALVLVRFLVALPVGAIVGGFLTRRFGAGVVTAAGMILAAGSFVAMTQWGVDSLDSSLSTVPLVVGGFGFGLALPAINAAVLASTDDEVHGLASAIVVVARMVGMLVGISALTAIGLRRYYARLEENPLPSAQEVCDGKTRCSRVLRPDRRGRDPAGARGVRRSRGVRPDRRRGWPWSCSEGPRRAASRLPTCCTPAGEGSLRTGGERLTAASPRSTTFYLWPTSMTCSPPTRGSPPTSSSAASTASPMPASRS